MFSCFPYIPRKQEFHMPCQAGNKDKQAQILCHGLQSIHTQGIRLGKRLGLGHQDSLAMYRCGAWGLLQARGPQQCWDPGHWTKNNYPLNIHNIIFSQIMQKAKWQNLIDNEIREVDLLLCQKEMITVYIYDTYITHSEHILSLCGCASQ